MSNNRKPYLRQKTSTHYIAIFGIQNSIFLEKIIDFCKNNELQCLFIRKTETGQLRYSITGNTFKITELKLWIKQSYDEFHYYNRELKKIIQDRHPLINSIINVN